MREKNLPLSKLCQIVSGPQIQTRPQTVPLKWATTKHLLYNLKGCAWNKMFSLLCLKAKIEENLTKIGQIGQKQICPFWGQTNFEFYFWWLVFGLKEGIWKFKKIYMFKVPVIFLKWKICCACAVQCACAAYLWPNTSLFWNWTQTNIPDRGRLVGRGSSYSLLANII